MSSRIEYQWQVFRVVLAGTAAAERFVVAIEGGDNNCSDWSTGKRARDWYVGMIGTEAQVLKQAVRAAGGCAGGSLQPHGEYCTPESYIRRIRRLLEKAGTAERGHWAPRIRIPVDHPAAELARSLELTIEEGGCYGIPETAATFPTERLAKFFDFVDRCPDLRPWQVAEVYGLPNS